MGIKHFKDLLVWQLAEQLREYVFEITDRGQASRDFALKGQVRRSSSSVCDNTAEGFGRYGHGEFARFPSIAKGSLDETENHLIAGHKQGYFTDQVFEEGRRRVVRANAALLKLLRYLRRTEAPRPFVDR